MSLDIHTSVPSTISVNRPNVWVRHQQFIEETSNTRKKKINDYDSNNEMLFTVETRGYLYVNQSIHNKTEQPKDREGNLLWHLEDTIL